MKLFLIDAVNYLFRSYYAITPMTNDKGQSTAALYGFIRSIQKIFKIFAPEPIYIAVVFDGPDNKKARQVFYAEYKMNRKKAPDDLYPQFELAYNFCELAGISAICVPNVEADDTIASIAKWASTEGNFEVVICSSDKDFYQLVSDKIFVFNAKSEIIMDAKKVEELFGLPPSQMEDYLAITGDASDNVPGIEGFGPKTAIILLKEFGSLDNIFSNIDKITNPRKREILLSQKENALLSKKLISLDFSVPFQRDETFFKVKDPNIKGLATFYKEMKFFSLLEKLKIDPSSMDSLEQPKTASSSMDSLEQQKDSSFKKTLSDKIKIVENSEVDSCSDSLSSSTPLNTVASFVETNATLQEEDHSSTKKPSYKETSKHPTKDSKNDFLYKLINSDEELKSLKTLLATKREKELCIDTETTNINPFIASLVGVGIGADDNVVYYIPLNGNIKKKNVIYFLKEIAITHSFYGHNIKYDIHVLENEENEGGIFLKRISFDTLLASYLLAPQNRRHNLDILSLEHFDIRKIPIESLIGEGKSAVSMAEVPIEKIKDYCCEDVEMTMKLKSLFTENLEKMRLNYVMNAIEMPLLSVLVKMEKNGVFINKDHFATLSKEFSKRLLILQEEIFKYVGKEFNLNSPKQLAEVLYKNLAIPSPSRKKDEENSTAAHILEKLVSKHPFIEKILKYRSLQKLLSTYVDALPLLVNEKSHRIHATFNQSMTATGRLSCNEPNLQNIPLHSDDGVKIREGFIPEKNGWSFLSFDYSQIELRLLAHFSEDPVLIKAFLNKEDIHSYTASLIFGMDSVTKEMRHIAKGVNFGILYGQSPFGLAEQLKISSKDASFFMKTYFDRYPKVFSYLESCKRVTEETKMAKTITGRTRHIPEIDSKNPQIKSMAQRLAMNTPLQGTAADIIKLAMIAVDKEITERKLSGFMILQIHDELVFEVPDKEIEIFKIFVKEKMENIFSLKVPLTVDISVGKNFGEC